jgi:hypothetical protein
MQEIVQDKSVVVGCRLLLVVGSLWAPRHSCPLSSGPSSRRAPLTELTSTGNESDDQPLALCFLSTNQAVTPASKKFHRQRYARGNGSPRVQNFAFGSAARQRRKRRDHKPQNYCPLPLRRTPLFPSPHPPSST